jgi:hypothetical protein
MTRIILQKYGDEVKLMAPMDPVLLKALREIDYARWDKKEEAWFIHNSEIDDFVDFISNRGFEVSYF